MCVCFQKTNQIHTEATYVIDVIDVNRNIFLNTLDALKGCNLVRSALNSAK